MDGTKSKRRCSLKSSATLPSGDFISRSLRSNVRLAATLWGCARRASSARQDHRAKIIARPQQAAQRGPKEARKQQSAKVTLGSRTHISRDTLWHKRVSLSLVATRECLCLFCVAVGARAKHKAQSTKHKAQSAKFACQIPAKLRAPITNTRKLGQIVIWPNSQLKARKSQLKTPLTCP